MLATEGTPFGNTNGKNAREDAGALHPKGRSTILSDLVHGLEANGVVNGGPCADEIFGDDGDDTLFGGKWR